MFAAVASIGIATFSGCSKSSSSPSYSMNATINGKSFSSSNATATIVATDSSLAVVSATTYPYVTLAIYNYKGVGTYTTSSSVTNLFGIDSSTSSAVIATTGTVTITSVSSSVVSGTYSFTCTDNTTVTGGTFTAHVL